MNFITKYTGIVRRYPGHVNSNYRPHAYGKRHHQLQGQRPFSNGHQSIHTSWHILRLVANLAEPMTGRLKGILPFLCVFILTSSICFGAESNTVFQDNEDNTITDTRTGLVWFRNASSNGRLMTREEAIRYCQNLSRLRHSNWRLPTLDEIKFLVSEEKDDRKKGEYLENNGFTGLIPRGGYWTGTTDPSDVYVSLIPYIETTGNAPKNFVWPVKDGIGTASTIIENHECTGKIGAILDNGEITVVHKTNKPLQMGDTLHIENKTGPRVVLQVTFPMMSQSRCKIVSGKVSDIKGGDSVYSGEQTIINQVFHDNGDGTITDTRTGLVWLKKSTANGYLMTKENAIKFCSSMSINGRTNWRIPTLEEIKSLVIDEKNTDDKSEYLLKNGFTDIIINDSYWTTTKEPLNSYICFKPFLVSMGKVPEHYLWPVSGKIDDPIPDFLLEKALGGNADDQFNIGIYYFCQRYDDEAAAEWLQKAADRGHSDAQFLVGAFFYNGQGIKKDVNAALQLWKKAADQGNVNAQCMLGICYHKGLIVKRDDDTAAKWFRKAADQGNFTANFFLGTPLYGESDAILKEINDFAAVKLPAVFRETVRSRAEKKDPCALWILGLMCYFGNCGFNEDVSAAVEWYNKSAEAGFIEAQLALAFYYLNSDGVKNDPEAAKVWLRKAAAQGNKEATVILKDMD